MPSIMVPPTKPSRFKHGITNTQLTAFQINNLQSRRQLKIKLLVVFTFLIFNLNIEKDGCTQLNKSMTLSFFKTLKKLPWLVWLSGLSAGL